MKALYTVLLLGLCCCFDVSTAFEVHGYSDDGVYMQEATKQFLKHFNTDKPNPLPLEISYFTTWNNYDPGIDDADFAYVNAYGREHAFATNSIDSVFISSAGSSSHKGWGDADLEFVIVTSCRFIPAPPDTSDWSSVWVAPNSIYDGVHQILGFRTDSWQDTGINIANAVGEKISNCETVYTAWFDAINEYGEPGSDDDMGSVILHPDNQDENFCSGGWGRDPDENSGAVRIWYQY